MTQELSRHGIGASQSAAALGMSPWSTPLDLYLEYHGLVPGFEGNENTRWGKHEEPAILSWYREETGYTVDVPSRSLFHPQHEWMRATPDGVAVRGKRLVEIKKANWRQAHRWGEIGSDVIPTEYMIQVAQQMAVTNIDVCDICVSIGGDPPQIYTQHRDPELEALIVDGVGAFYREFIVPKIQPPIDHSQKFRDYLISTYPQRRADYLEADTEIEEVVGLIREVRMRAKDCKRQQDALENKLGAFIGDARGTNTAIGRVTWGTRNGSVKHKTVGEQLAKEAGKTPKEHQAMLDATRGAASRSFTYPQKGWSK